MEEVIKCVHLSADVVEFLKEQVPSHAERIIDKYSKERKVA